MATPRYRIGNDITILWAINNRDGSPFNMANKEIRLFVTNSRGREEVEATLTTLEDGSVSNVIRWDYSADKQKALGLYKLEAEIYTNEHKKIRKDISEAFTLVSLSEQEEGEEGEANIYNGGELILSSTLDVYRFGIPKVEIGTNGNWYIDEADTGVSALGGGPGLVKILYKESDLGKEFDKDSVIDTFNAYAINEINRRTKALEEKPNPRLKELSDVSITGENEDHVLIYEHGLWKNMPFGVLLKNYGGSAQEGSGSGECLWEKDEEKGEIFTDSPVRIKNNLIIEGDVASGGTGENNYAGVYGVRVNGTLYEDENRDGVIDLGIISGGDVDVDLTDYQTWDVTKNYIDTEVGKNDQRLDKIETWSNKVSLVDGNIQIAGNLVVLGDTASGGNGQDTPSGGLDFDEEELKEFIQDYLDEEEYVDMDDLNNRTVSLMNQISGEGQRVEFLLNQATSSLDSKITSNTQSIETLHTTKVNREELGELAFQDTSKIWANHSSIAGVDMNDVTVNAHAYFGNHLTNSSTGVSGITNRPCDAGHLLTFGGTCGFQMATDNSKPVMYYRRQNTAKEYSAWDEFITSKEAQTISGAKTFSSSVTMQKDLIVSGDVSSGSDIRFKDVVEDKQLSLEDMASAPCFSFKWNDREDEALHLGTSAQYWEEVAPELVCGDEFKKLNYASLGVAGMISLARIMQKYEERINALEEEIKELKRK